MVITKTKAFIVATGILAASLRVSAPAGADPAGDPCEGSIAVTILCKMMPIAPELDHDIDLTQGPGSLNGEALPEMPEGAPSSDTAPTPICPSGC